MRAIGLNKRATELRNRLGARPRKRSRTSQEGGSGLIRASRIRATLGPALGAGHDAESPSSEGISADDRREIEDEIDGVSRRNRLSARPEDFVVRPRRKGFLFPLAVNLLAVAATALAILVLSRVFLQRDVDIASMAASLETAEGKLLRELKRDSESRLLEKDRAIADFQSRIRAIDKERSELASNIDDRVRTKEAELRAILKSEVEAERERLAEERISASARESRLRTYEAEKTAALDRLLSEERAAAEAEKSAAEEKYRQLKDDYQKSVSSLGEERKRLQDESRKREAEIRSQAEVEARALEAQGAAARAGLERARAELSSLADQKAKQSAIEERVLGLYESIRSALRERRYEDAATGAEALASYLSDPELAANPSIKPRRDADLFVAETLGTYARAELARSAADANRLLEQASTLASAREDAQAAQTALKAGDAAGAQAKFSEALSKIPEILSAHEYFLERARSEEAARRAKLDEYLAAADRAYRSGDRALMTARYLSALEYLPISETARREIIARLGQPSAASAAAHPPVSTPANPTASPTADPAARAPADRPSVAESARKAADTRAARPVAAEASRRLAAKDWSGAIGEYVRLLSSYPAADQAGEALAGIETASSGLRNSAEAAEAEAAASLKAEMEKTSAAIARADKDAASLASSKAEIEALKKQLAEEQEKTAKAAASVAPAASTAAQAAGAGEIAALKAEVERLSSAAARHEGLVAAYKAYRASEAATDAKAGSAALVEASARLDAFLGSEEAKRSLPGLQESVARYEQAYQRAGQREVLYNALDLLDGAVRARDAASRERYFKDLESRYAGDDAMLDFIKGLRRNLK